MNKKQFESLMNMARAMEITGATDNDYYIGYTRGLRRAHFGDIFGSEEDHNLWYNIAQNEIDVSKHMQGIGYRDGYKGKTPINNL